MYILEYTPGRLFPSGFCRPNIKMRLALSPEVTCQILGRAYWQAKFTVKSNRFILNQNKRRYLYRQLENLPEQINAGGVTPMQVGTLYLHEWRVYVQVHPYNTSSIRTLRLPSLTVTSFSNSFLTRSFALEVTIFGHSIFPSNIFS